MRSDVELRPDVEEVSDAATQAGQFSLQDKYNQADGIVLLSGIQALVRALLTRARLDAASGMSTGGFVSGYRGSPLGGLDKELWLQQQALKEQNIQFQPGVNEDLAATAVWGSQQVGLHPGAEVDGVFGLWYGKAPGLDRSCDAIRHANAWGTSASGGVLLVVGDDPAAKSSSLATQSEFALQDMMVPVLAPADVQDVLDFAVLGWQMSRYSGAWVGLKALADHMDGAATISVDADRFTFDQGALSKPADVHIRREDNPLDQERRLAEAKIPAVIEFAATAGFNQWITEQPHAPAAPPRRARLGIIAAGKAYRDVREALVHFGYLNEQDIAQAGIEVLKLGMTWPLDPSLISSFAAQVDQLLVVEEKRAFVEPQVKEILYQAALPVRPMVYGKCAGENALHGSGKRVPGLPQTGTLSVHRIVELLVELLQLPKPAMLRDQALAAANVAQAGAPARQERTPLFCAGCPHNTSTRVPDGSRATAGIGCHYMVQWMDRDTDSCTQMGGEGVTWVGEAPFTAENHIFANLGDGTYFHSGLLAIRQAVAAGVNITYKILYNDAVAMTGGQPTDGELSVADVIRQVRAEGVSDVVVVSDEPRSQRVDLAGSGLDVQVYDRSDLHVVQTQLREQPGTTVLIYQQTCATELRRRRKRGTVVDDKPRVVINEALCDGCGDCTVQSSCVAVEPVDTVHGVKRRINQTICNKDLSCTSGYCPAFVEVRGALRAGVAASLEWSSVGKLAPAPVQPNEQLRAANVLVTGVGGTGIVTLSALLAVAAKVEGRQVQTLDMTGLAQKGGAVFAHVRIGGRIGDRIGGERRGELISGRTDNERPHVARITDGCADVVVGCDLVSAASNEALALLSDSTSVALNTHVMPTAEFVLNQSSDTQHRKRLARVQRAAGDISSCDAEQICADLLGNTLPANVLLLGFAYQRGGISIGLPAIEEAIRLNGVRVEENLLAFHIGRVTAHDRDALQTLYPADATVVANARAEHEADLSLDELVAVQAAHLTDYADEDLAQRYIRMVEVVTQVEQQVREGSEQLTRAVANGYARVLAVKDEYEVARLHLLPEFAHQLGQQFAADAALTYLLAPPLMGTKKRRFGAWMRAGFYCLRALKGIRNTWLDPFRYSSERRRSQQLIKHYEQLLAEILPVVNLQNLAVAAELARLPEHIRGFGHVKEQQMRRAFDQQQHLLAQFHEPPTPVNVFDPGPQVARVREA